MAFIRALSGNSGGGGITQATYTVYDLTRSSPFVQQLDLSKDYCFTDIGSTQISGKRYHFGSIINGELTILRDDSGDNTQTITLTGDEFRIVSTSSLTYSVVLFELS